MLRFEMDRLFDSFMEGLPTFPSMFGPSSALFGLTPSLDVKETDKEIVVEAGLEEKDISLTIQNGVLTIRTEASSPSQ
jgi:HSP20 family protein